MIGYLNKALDNFKLTSLKEVQGTVRSELKESDSTSPPTPPEIADAAPQSRRDYSVGAGGCQRYQRGG